MDDPLFDPWSLADEAPEKQPGTSRWRSAVPPSPTLPSPRPIPSARQMPRRRLGGTPGFLRTMAVPRLENVAQRLTMARHEALVEDLLDSVPPVVRLTLRPWRGPLTATTPVQGCLELEVEASDDQYVSLRSRAGDDDRLVERVPVDKLGASWLERQIVEFVGRLLGDA